MRLGGDDFRLSPFTHMYSSTYYISIFPLFPILTALGFSDDEILYIKSSSSGPTIERVSVKAPLAVHHRTFKADHTLVSEYSGAAYSFHYEVIPKNTTLYLQYAAEPYTQQCSYLHPENRTGIQTVTISLPYEDAVPASWSGLEHIMNAGYVGLTDCPKTLAVDVTGVQISGRTAVFYVNESNYQAMFEKFNYQYFIGDPRSVLEPGVNGSGNATHLLPPAEASQRRLLRALHEGRDEARKRRRRRLLATHGRGRKYVLGVQFALSWSAAAYSHRPQQNE